MQNKEKNHDIYSIWDYEFFPALLFVFFTFFWITFILESTKYTF